MADTRHSIESSFALERQYASRTAVIEDAVLASL